MSFLNLKARLGQKSPTADGALSHINNNNTSPTNIKRKVSCTSNSEIPHLVVGSPECSNSDTSSTYTNMVVRTEEPVRLFICDRRRAILEKIEQPSPIQLENGEKPPVPNIFIADQYADNSAPSWAFRFDFNFWNDQYNIEEIWLQNFCSFLDREHGKMAIEGAPGTRLDHKGHQNSTVLTPPYSADSRVQTNHGNHAPPSEDRKAYHSLPSSQPVSDHYVNLDEEACAVMTQLSGGRLERLARSLSPVSPGHILFRDHSFYPHRPTILLFWFLRILSNKVPRLTFDSIQSDTRIVLHEVVDFQELEELTVIQPIQRPAFTITSELLMKWLKVSCETNLCRIRMMFTGCREITAHGLAAFIKEWRLTPSPCLFDTISFDASSVSLNDFIQEVENPQKHGEDNDWRPPTPPSSSSFGLPTIKSSQSKQFVFKHKKLTAQIHYKYADGYLVLSCISASQLSASLPRAASDKGLASVQHGSFSKLNGRGLHRNTTCNATLSGMSNAIEVSSESSLVDKMFNFLLRSNA